MAKKYNELDDKDYEDGTFEAEGRVVNYKKTTVDYVKQDYINLNEADKEFINYCLGDADDLLRTLPDDKNLENYSAKDLDELLYRWNNKKYDFKFFDEEQFVNAIGAAFGKFLNKEFQTIWNVISDEYGTDYACVSTGEHSFQLFPFSSAWKAVEQNREDSLDAIVLIVKKNMEEWKKSK
ncbi:DUF3806 domain-containing protein [Dysgonomonas sp. 520]|uniref:DUF3806 domain-containing protein n=1 Tax=Dysgonomonas sp. 520 TaxID=2302931 RepID=UPI0013D5BD3B|nr:DUF3806 domain-containing protein [Dysgonomonas sp. 520]NDW09228.1 DUF3806 domain-containing protein [Dysgonomonas sp. 520]